MALLINIRIGEKLEICLRVMKVEEIILERQVTKDVGEQLLFHYQILSIISTHCWKFLVLTFTSSERNWVS